MPDQKTENSKGVVSPLSVPLVKNPTSTPAQAAGQATADKKVVTQAVTKQVETILQPATQKFRFPFAQVLITAFLIPFFYNAGNESYKYSVSYLEKHYDLKLTYQPAVFNHGAKKDTGNGTKKILILSNQTGRFSFKFEKQKLLELAGIDIDDPINGSGTINRIESAEILITVIDSFSSIILNGRGKDVSSFHLKNSVEGKKQAIKRLRKLNR